MKKHLRKNIALFSFEALYKRDVLCDFAFWVGAVPEEELEELAEAYALNSSDKIATERIKEFFHIWLEGKSIEDLNTGEFWHTIINEDYFYKTSLQTLKTLNDHGAEIHVISGSPKFLVDGVNDYANTKIHATEYWYEDDEFSGDFEFVGTELKKRAIVEDIVARTEKKFLMAHGHDETDLSMFEICELQLLVDPTDEALALIEEHFSPAVLKI